MSQIGRKPSPPSHWRSLAELEGSTEFQEHVEREFAVPPEPEPPDSPGRRRFMQLMGASMALGGSTTACRWKRDQILPHTRRAEGHVPGEARQYATTMDLGGVATGLRVTSFDGRPIKVEGNPLHPESLGACSAFHQASILGLYDPDRSQTPSRLVGPGARNPAAWSDFERFAEPHFAGLLGSRGKGLRVLAEETSSPAVADMRRRFLASFPEARWVEYEPLSRDHEREGMRMAFGKPYRGVVHLSRADVVLTLDADLVADDPAGVRHARELAEQRTPERGRMTRVFAVESSYSPTGAWADHRLPLRSTQLKAFAAALDARISARAQALPEQGTAQPSPPAAFLRDPKVESFLATVGGALLSSIGRSVVLAGPRQPPEVHALACRLNVLLDSYGRTIELHDDTDPERQSHVAALRQLVQEMRAGQVGTLLILGGNPVYNAPVDLDFGGALEQVGTSIHLSLYEDETSLRTTWHLPQSHFLEAWGDGSAKDGTPSLSQPLIAPLYTTRSALELLALVTADPVRDGLGIVRRRLSERQRDRRLWERMLHDGVWAESKPASQRPMLAPLPRFAFTDDELAGSELPNGRLELVFTPDPKLYDGRFANNAWLQELPDPFTKLTWDNAALIAPETARHLGIEDGTLVTLTLGGRSLSAPAIYAPGQAQGSVAISLGYGRTAGGSVAGSTARGVPPVGANAYSIRTSQAPFIAGGLTISGTGPKVLLATTQHLHAIDQLGREGEAERLGAIVREGTLARFQEEPDFAAHAVHHPKLLNLWKDPVSYEGRRWGMTIDLTKCIGCNACVVACQAENNVPVVGKQDVAKGREMHWLRIDRYFSGPADEPAVAFQPVLCQHCENAPCEQVCPVGATMHSSEGLNEMVYNRCIGTRYCSNNCPYKVRRYNYFNFNLQYTDPGNQVKQMGLNPEVTVRARGVMEKCTFCVQRIQKAKIRAKNARRSVTDGEVVTACQQTCPTQAIVFGDLNDRGSQVAKLHDPEVSPRSYALLGQLNNRPRIHYLARIKHPHPDLEPSVLSAGAAPAGHSPKAAHSQPEADLLRPEAGATREQG